MSIVDGVSCAGSSLAMADISRRGRREGSLCRKLPGRSRVVLINIKLIKVVIEKLRKLLLEGEDLKSQRKESEIVSFGGGGLGRHVCSINGWRAMCSVTRHVPPVVTRAGYNTS